MCKLAGLVRQVFQVQEGHETLQYERPIQCPPRTQAAHHQYHAVNRRYVPIAHFLYGFFDFSG